ncbi:MAG: tetratricopeptide repeat protein [Bacteroidetes bacterium]|nr:tetratricopeptide repeat protein [Bacteroidota bacterium]
MKNILVIFFSFFLLVISFGVSAQSGNALIRQGNRNYKQKKFDESQADYQKALTKSPDNPNAYYNLGNSQFRKNSFDDAVKSFDAGLERTQDKDMQQKELYNKGVALIKQQKLDESIDAWKNALKLNPDDLETRENLQKALLEKKSQEKQKQKEEKQDQKKEEKKEQQKPQQSRLSKQQVDQLLKALTQKEKDVQDKMNQNKTKSSSQPDKDW